jgi:hypothetical protein
MNRTIVIDKHEVVVDRDYLEKLQNDSAMLECLDACKVTNWGGYDAAVVMFEKEYTAEGEEYGP